MLQRVDELRREWGLYSVVSILVDNLVQLRQVTTLLLAEVPIDVGQAFDFPVKVAEGGCFT
jgi:hypothetical protein